MTTINTNLIQLLTEIGFSENESKVYLASLELGPRSIWDIAKKSQVKRPTCYVILEDLALRGLASSANDGRRVIYTVVGPKQLALYQERRNERFIASLGQLEAIADQAELKPKITTYEGAGGIRQVFLSLISAMKKGSVTYVSGANLLTGEYQSVIEELIEIRKKRNIASKAIFPDTAENRKIFKDQINEIRQVKFLATDRFNPRTQINIFGDTVAYIVPTEKEPFATVIESKSLARDEKEKFELLWGLE